MEYIFLAIAVTTYCAVLLTKFAYRKKSASAQTKRLSEMDNELKNWDVKIASLQKVTANMKHKDEVDTSPKNN